MKISDILRSIAPRQAKHCTAIIVAGGSGSRMNSGNTTKQMINLYGMPVVARTISIFEECKKIKDIVIVAKEDEAESYKKFMKQYSFKKVRAIVKGGATRQESVLNGFKKISEKCDYVAIHDGARCLVTAKNIEDVISAAEKYRAATAAAPVKNTIKLADSKGFAVSTPDRSRLWAAQTPQVFKADVYRAAAFYALEEGFEATDDNSLAENIGIKVKLVDCGYENIKITTSEDLYTAEMLLKTRSSKK